MSSTKRALTLCGVLLLTSTSIYARKPLLSNDLLSERNKIQRQSVKNSNFARDLQGFKAPTGAAACAQTYNAEMNAANGALESCYAQAESDFNALSNSQLVQICGNKTMLQCYNDFINPKRRACANTYKLAKDAAIKKGFECVATVIHNEFCEKYAKQSDMLEGAAKSIEGCNIGDHSYDSHLNWCKNLAVSQRGEPKKHLDKRKRDVKACIDRLK